MFPLYRQLEAISNWLIRSDSGRKADDLPLKPLEERFINHPSLAIKQCMEAINDMAIQAKENLLLSLELINRFIRKTMNMCNLLRKL